MEVLNLPGYSEEEKTLIAQKYIIPKQLDAHGLTDDDLEITDQAIRKVIADYTREAGLRNLEREIAALCRKVARRRAEGKRRMVTIGPAQVAELLGPSRYFRELVDRTGVPGVATGLAWTPTGGEILFIEATGMAGKGGLTLTGLLGDSMRESAQAAMSYLRSHAKLLALDASRISKTDVHIHVPAGAVPKDGPSAGVAIASALISLFRDQPITNELAMTGEVTLTGRVLPVGGVRDKVLAARRAGIRTVLLPRHNEKDLVELPPEVKADLTFRLVDTLDDVVPRLFESSKAKPRRKPEPLKPATERIESVKRKKIASPGDQAGDAPSPKTHRRSRSL
jgi:ATP-dependent Lon protease